jgi:hypothetical protein
MPVVLRIGPYTFFFYMGDAGEPPHIHVRRDDAVCKFWLVALELAKNEGFRMSELRKIGTLVRENRDLLLEAWNAEFTRGV